MAVLRSITPLHLPHEKSFLLLTQSLTCADTVSQGRAGEEVPGALRPQLSEGSVRLPGSQSLGSTGLAVGNRGLRAGVPELPGSAAAISRLGEAQPGIRDGLL